MGNFETLSTPWVAAGWSEVLPLPKRSKFAPPAGYTGKHAKSVTEADLSTWATRSGNWAIRMPENAVGLDIDAYKPESRETLASLEAKLGKLPKTWRISSRKDGSGIYLFRNVSRSKLTGAAGPGIEIIQPHHRYAVAPGSIHPNGSEYMLLDAEGNRTNEVPTVRQLPRLPRAWVAHLKQDNLTTKTAPRRSSTTRIQYEKADLSGELPKSMEAVVSRFMDRINSGGSRYDAVLKATYAIAMLRLEGVPGAELAFASLEELYVSSVLDSRSEAVARREFHRMVKGL